MRILPQRRGAVCVGMVQPTVWPINHTWVAQDGPFCPLIRRTPRNSILYGCHERLAFSAVLVRTWQTRFFFTSLSVTYCTNLVTYPNPGTSPSPIDASPRLQTAPYTYAWHYDPCNAENLVWLAWAGDRTKSHRRKVHMLESGSKPCPCYISARPLSHRLVWPKDTLPSCLRRPVIQ